MKIGTIAASLALAAAFALPVHAQQEDRVKAELKKRIPEAPIDSVRKANYGGLYEVLVGGEIYYTDEAATYLLTGSLIDLKTKTNVTELRLRQVNAVKWSALIPRNSIRVEVSKGWLTLDGAVQWQFQRDAAEEAVRHLNGVRGVSNLISLKTPISKAVIKADIEAALKRTAQLDAAQIDVAVAGHDVTLTGSVKTYAERQEAARAAWAAPGVDSVQNRLSVEGWSPYDNERYAG